MNLKRPIASLLILAVHYSYPQKYDRFTLVQADKQKHEAELSQFVGNVEFIRDENYLYCDSAVQFKSENKLECFGNVKLIKAGAYTFTGDHLIVSEKKRKVVMDGDVFLRKKKKEINRRRYKLKLR